MKHENTTGVINAPTRVTLKQGLHFPEDADNAEPARAPPEDPAWIRHAFDEARREVIAWLRTFWAIATRPARFARAWVDGEADALGPLAFMGASAALLGAGDRLFGALLGLKSDAPLWKDALEALAPYAYYAAVGVIAHLLLRLFFPLRRITSSLAASLFAGGAMPMLSYLVCLALLPLFSGLKVTGSSASSDNQLMLLIGIVPLVWFYVSLARALTGMHRVRGWVTGLVVLLLALLTTFAPARVPLPLWHLHAELSLDGGLGNNLHLTNT